ncbi:MAG: acyltransferase [Alistipes sp.]|nr:acyltransferase [Alistipes sp.]
MSSTNYLTQSKPHYPILDGLRGVAAIIVLVYHLCEGCGIVMGHAYLGVDFFFALSGFVVGYAYDDRWGKMTIGAFFKRRIIRLHPMVVMGTFIGLLFYYFGQSEAFPIIGTQPWWFVLLMFFYCCLMLPMPNAWDVRGWQDFNSFNGNIWSLHWEYFANILYALVFRFLPTCALAVLAVVAAVGTIDITFNLDIFNLFDGARVGAPHSVNGGWSITGAELYIGFVRVMYPFIAGLLLSRMKRQVKTRHAFAICSLIIGALLLWPQMSGMANGIYEAAVILLLIPFIVSMGAGGKIEGDKAKRVCDFLGEISYPLYITHLPFIYMQMAWMSAHPDAPTSAVIMLAASLFVLSILVAYACMKLYDIPIRKWLSNRIK